MHRSAAVQSCNGGPLSARSLLPGSRPRTSRANNGSLPANATRAGPCRRGTVEPGLPPGPRRPSPLPVAPAGPGRIPDRHAAPAENVPQDWASQHAASTRPRRLASRLSQFQRRGHVRVRVPGPAGRSFFSKRSAIIFGRLPKPWASVTEAVGFCHRRLLSTSIGAN